MRSDVHDYTRTDVERAVLELYPDLRVKGPSLKMWYHDSLVGKVWIKGDADMQAALTSFIEATEQAEGEVDVKYVTLHAEDWIDPNIPHKHPLSDADADANVQKPAKKRKVSLRLPRRQCELRSLHGHVTYIILVTRIVSFLFQERAFKSVDLLVKCNCEDEVEKQQLYIDEELECIKCTWCLNWKGFQETKVINQHIKSAKSHDLERQRLRGKDVRQSIEKAAQGMRDIRQFIKVNQLCASIFMQ